MSNLLDSALIQLNSTGLAKTDPKLYQFLKTFLGGAVQTNERTEIVISGGGGGGGGGAITGLTNDLSASGPGVVPAIINPNVVTFGKIQTLNSQTVIGRDTAGVGNSEPVSASQLIDWLTNILGDTIARGSSFWQRIAGNITTTRMFYRQVGDGIISSLPVWDTLVAADLPNTAVAAGTYGDSTHVGQFTVDAKGRITNAANVAIAASGSSADYVLMSDGVTPTPNPVNDGFGNFIYITYTP